jgi:hypothetical protein
MCEPVSRHVFLPHHHFFSPFLLAFWTWRRRHMARAERRHMDFRNCYFFRQVSNRQVNDRDRSNVHPHNTVSNNMPRNLSPLRA